MGIFGSSFIKPGFSRRDSFVSVDGDDHSQSQSPSARHGSQSTIESELPPTPTKQVFLPSSNSHLSRSHPSRPDHSQPSRPESLSGPQGPSCKLSLVWSAAPRVDEDSDSVADLFPSTNQSLKSSESTFWFSIVFTQAMSHAESQFSTTVSEELLSYFTLFCPFLFRKC